MITIKQSPQFANLKKKLYKNQLNCLDKAIKEIALNIEIGELKTGDLKDIRVYKFEMIKERWLIAYKIDGNELILLILFGSHENFYNDLKRYLSKINI